MNSSTAMIQGVVLLLGGLVMCFRGRALFRVVLPVAGFVLFGLTAMVMARPHAPGDPMTVIAVGLVGGLLGAALLMAAYIYGLFLVGATFGGHIGAILAARLGYDPGGIILFAGILGGIAAVFAERLLITLATALWGSMFAISGYLLLTGQLAADRLLEPAALATFAQRADLAPLAWVLLAAAGVVVQTRTERPVVVVS